MIAEKRRLPMNAYRDNAFSTEGFFNWKKGLERFEIHECIAAHREAVQMLVSKTRDVGEMLCDSYALEKVENKKMLSVIIGTIRFLGRQGLALRGHQKTCTSNPTESGELDSNFVQLLRLRAEDNEGLHKFLNKKQDKFTSPDIQNEILEIMSLTILRSICGELTGKWYSIMVDECTDASNTEQMVFCLRYVDDNLEVHEDTLGFYNLERTDAAYIMTVLQDTLLRFNLHISNCRGQCYDGAGNMAGVRSGVATRITGCEKRALFSHCYGHSLNLATQDTLKAIKIIGDCLDTVYEITKLIKKSPKREGIFNSIKDDISNDSPGIRVLCPTRWTVKAEALASISENYRVLQLTWESAKNATTDTEMKARILGVAAQMVTSSLLLN